MQSRKGFGHPNQVQGGSLANRVGGGYAYGHCGSRKNIATFYICIEGKILVVLKTFEKICEGFLLCKEKHASVGIYIRDSDKGMAYATYYVIFLRKMHKQRYMQNA